MNARGGRRTQHPPDGRLSRRHARRPGGPREGGPPDPLARHRALAALARLKPRPRRPSMQDALTTFAPGPATAASPPLDGRSAVVTGAASGLGLAFVEALCEAGARVTMTDLSAARLAEQGERLRGLGYDIHTEAADVTDAARADAIMAGVAGRQGGVDIFFANAGIDPGPGYAALDADGRRSDANRLENYDFTRWSRVVDISLNAVFLGLRAAARQMRPRGKGSIVVTTSISALRPRPGSARPTRRRRRGRPSSSGPRRSSSRPRASGSTPSRPGPSSPISATDSPTIPRCSAASLRACPWGGWRGRRRSSRSPSISPRRPRPS